MKKKRIKIKRLSLESWMKWDLNGEGLEEIDPVFNRDGYYFKNDRVWFEVNGKAYLYQVSTFKLALAILMHSRLRDVDFEALTSLVKTGFKSKEIASFYRYEVYARETRERRVESGLLLQSIKLS